MNLNLQIYNGIHLVSRLMSFLCVPPGLIPDKEVRVSVKALAVSCVGAAAALHPEAFFNSLYLEPLDGIPAEGRGSRKWRQSYLDDAWHLNRFVFT